AATGRKAGKDGKSHLMIWLGRVFTREFPSRDFHTAGFGGSLAARIACCVSLPGKPSNRWHGLTMNSPSPAGASSCLFHPAQRVGVVDGFVGAVSTAEVKGEGDVTGGG